MELSYKGTIHNHLHLGMFNTSKIAYIDADLASISELPVQAFYKDGTPWQDSDSGDNHIMYFGVYSFLNTEKVSKINAFAYYGSFFTILKELNFPSVEVIEPNGIPQLGSTALSIRSMLSEVIGDLPLYQNVNLPKVKTIKTYGLYGIPADAENGVVSLPSIEVIEEDALGEGTFNAIHFGNNLTSIGDYAIGGCMNLTTVSLPSSLEYLGNRAFNYCDKLETVFFDAMNESVSIESYYTQFSTFSAIYVKDTLTPVWHSDASSYYSEIATDVAGYTKFIKK